jgi:signal transduction histidine kinase
MSSDSGQSSANPDPGRGGAASSIRRRRSLRLPLAYALFAAILANWIATPLLLFSQPTLTYTLIWVYLACLLGLFYLFLGALFRFWRRWKEVAILLAIGAVVLLPYYRLAYLIKIPAAALVTIAFRVHSYPVAEYLARCNLIQFNEHGSEQSLGQCERFGVGNEDAVAVFYDSTGEFILPVSQRSPEWTAAMRHFQPEDLLTKVDNRASHLYGNFYDILLD